MTPPDHGPSHIGRSVRAFLAVILPPDRLVDVLGDLEEAVQARAATGTGISFRYWYARQIAAYAFWGLTDRFETRGVRARTGGRVQGPLAALRYDLRHAVRALGRAPVFAGMSTITLALGIGGNTAVFSVVAGVILEPLPYHQPDRLVAIHETLQGQSYWSAAPRNVLAWRERSETLAGVAWSQMQRRSLAGAGAPVQVGVATVSENFLDVVGVAPIEGRGFLRGEDRSGGAHVVILTDEFWRARLGARPDVVGMTLSLDGIPHEVIGLLPPGKTPSFAGRYDVMTPRVFTESELSSMGRVLQAIGRLAPDVHMSGAQREMDALAADLDASGTMRGWGVRLRPLREQVVGDVRPTILVLMGAVGFLLLVACVNVGNLFLARGTARRHELALRVALGASRGRLVGSLVLEATIVALMGGALGLPLAVWGPDALLALAPNSLPRMDGIGVDGPVLTFCLIVSLGSGLLFGLIPALHARRTAGFAARTSGLRSASADRREHYLRAAFVAVQVAAVLVLLVGAGLMLESFRRLQRVDTGFPLDDRLVLRMSVPATQYPGPHEVATFFEGLSERLRSIPGVRAAGAVTHVPLAGDDWTALQVVESLPEPEPGQEPTGGFEGVGPGYFEALGVPVLDGRTFTSREAAEGAPVVVINQALATRFWEGRSPVGDRIRMAPAQTRLGAWHTIVGVVGAVRYDLGEVPRPRVYIPERLLFAQARERHVVVHVEPGRTNAIAPSIRTAVAEYAPELAIAELQPLRAMATDSLGRTRMQTTLLAAFGSIGLMLGAVGVYGVVNYAVGGRTREIGVRLAVGASRGSVLAMVVRQALTPVLIGLAAGLLAALAAGRLMATTLFDVSPHDPSILGGLSALLLVVATIAAALPARRASRLDPVSTLRAE